MTTVPKPSTSDPKPIACWPQDRREGEGGRRGGSAGRRAPLPPCPWVWTLLPCNSDVAPVKGVVGWSTIVEGGGWSPTTPFTGADSTCRDPGSVSVCRKLIPDQRHDWGSLSDPRHVLDRRVLNPRHRRALDQTCFGPCGCPWHMVLIFFITLEPRAE